MKWDQRVLFGIEGRCYLSMENSLCKLFGNEQTKPRASVLNLEEVSI